MYRRGMNERISLGEQLTQVLCLQSTEKLNTFSHPEVL